MFFPFFLTEECALKTCLCKIELIYFQHNCNYSFHSPVVWLMHHYWIDTRHQVDTQKAGNLLKLHLLAEGFVLLYYN